MELKHLRVFEAVAETLHFGRAAERLHVAQPALSAQLRALEDELGVRLFFRTTRTVRLTGAGEAFLPEARRTLEQAERAARAARRAGATGAEALRIGGVDSATAGLLPVALREFLAARPGVDVKVLEMLSARALHCLDHRTLDVAFSRVPPGVTPGGGAPGEGALVSRRVLEERLLVACAAYHPLATDPAPTLAAVAAEPLVIPARAHRPILVGVVEDFLRRAGFEPNVHQAVDERHVTLAMVAAGLGITIVPEWVRGFSRPDLAFFELPGEPPRIPTHAVWRADETLDAVHEFVRGLPDASGAEPVEGSGPPGD